MSKIYVVYWSGTGNTEMMANSIGEGIKSKGVDYELVDVTRFSPSTLDSETVYALGCPSMGAEELEEDTMEPFVAELISNVSDKKIALFGSFDWGDGEWMRTWVSRMEDAGASIVGGEGLIVNNTPDTAALDECFALGVQLANLK